MTKEQEILETLGIHSWRVISEKEWCEWNKLTWDPYNFFDKRVCMNCGRVEILHRDPRKYEWKLMTSKLQCSIARKIVGYKQKLVGYRNPGSALVSEE
jgi:hypothetical protein